MIRKSKISIPAKGRIFQGYLNVPFEANSLVIFSYSVPNSRFNPRNRYTAEILNGEGIATFLTDLLSEADGRVAQAALDIEVMSARLAGITDVLKDLEALQGLRVGYFGVSAGVAYAMRATARLGNRVHAVVSHSGRPDLAETLIQVNAPTLLIAGSLDPELIFLNRESLALLRGKKKMHVVEGASHFFEESGKLGEAALFAAGWFKKYLPPSKPGKKEHSLSGTNTLI